MNNDRATEGDYFDRARRSDKLNPAVYCAIAEACITYGRQDTVTARLFIAQGLGVNQKYAGLHAATGNLEALKKNYGLAVNAYDRAIFFDPRSAMTYRNKGYLETITRSYKDALLSLTRSIQINPNQVLVYKYLGDLYYIIGKYPEAEIAYNTYLSRAEVTTDDKERLAFILFFNKKLLNVV